MTRPRRADAGAKEPSSAERVVRVRDRAMLARLAAHERWGRVRDRSAATAPARRAADDRFVSEARRIDPGLPEDELLKRARNLRSAQAVRAARARWRGTAREAGTRASHVGQNR